MTQAVTPVEHLPAVAETNATRPLRYPLWLGTASFVWALVGWVVALHAPALAFSPTVEVLHIAFPSITGLLILLNLCYALPAWLWYGVRIDRLMLVTALQIGLFTTLFHQISAHVGAEHFKLTKPTTPEDWIQFSLVHSLKASDVWDTIEAYGWFNQLAVKHNGRFVGTLLVAYHLVMGLFVLGVLRSWFGAVRRWLMSDRERAEFVRGCLGFGFVLFLVVWLISALWLRPWQAIDIPLWWVENVIRVIDFGDAMDCYDGRLHQLPKTEWQESTLTFVCRVWITIGIGLLMGWLRRSKSVDVTLSVGRVARLAFVGVLFAGFIGLPRLFPANAAAHAAAFATIAGEPDSERASVALIALRRMGPNAEAAIQPLMTLYRKSADDRRWQILDTIGRLGPAGLGTLAAIAEEPDAEAAMHATRGLNRVGVEAAAALVHVWKHSPHEAVRQQAENALRDFGPDAMPKLISSVTSDKSDDFVFWFNQLDRNWTLRSSDNTTFRAIVRWTRRGQDERERARLFVEELQMLQKTRRSKQTSEFDELSSKPLVDSLKDVGQAGRCAKTAVPAMIVQLTDPNSNVRLVASQSLEQIDPSWATSDAAWAKSDAVEVVLPLCEQLDNGEPHVRKAAVEILGKLAPAWVRSNVAIKAVDKLAYNLTANRGDLRTEVEQVIEKVGSVAVPVLIGRLKYRNKTLHEAATRLLGRIDPLWMQSDTGKAALIASLAHPDRNERVATEAALDRIDQSWPKSEAAKAAVPDLVAGLADRDRDVRLNAASVLGKIGAGASAALPDLHLLAEGDSDSLVRVVAQGAMRKIRGE